MKANKNMKDDIRKLEVATEEISILLAQRRIWKEFEEIIRFNRKLDFENSFIQMVMHGYISDQCMRVRRLVDARPHSLSLMRFLMELKNNGKSDKEELQNAGEKIKKYATKWLAHSAKDRESHMAGFNHLNEIIDELHKTCLKYINILPDYQNCKDLDLPLPGNWRSIFYSPWIPEPKSFIRFTS